MIDPPEPYRELAAVCRNVGCWPVLVGDEGDTIRSCQRRSFCTTIPRSHRRAPVSSSTAPRLTRSSRFGS